MISNNLKRILLRKGMSLLRENIRDKNHYSFIVEKNKIISFGVNRSYKTHPSGKKYNYRYESIHSELDCFIKLPKNFDLKNCKLVNIRLSKSSIKLNRPIIRVAKPCVCCCQWIYNLGLKDVIYTDSAGNFINNL